MVLDFSKRTKTLNYLIDNFEKIQFSNVGANIGLYSLYAAKKNQELIVLKNLFF